MRHRRGTALAVLALLMAPLPSRGETPPAAEKPAAKAAAGEAPAAEHARVAGFRSAQWGMTEAQVKTAIHKDFNLAADKIKKQENAVERTAVLTISVPDLLEGAGTARVSYIFGYTSKTLIQVNLLWGGAADPQTTAQKVVTAANELRQLFIDSGYKADTIVTNAKMPDGSILVFQGQDADKHMTVLRLASAAAAPPAAHGKSAEKPAMTTALALSYILDASSPDVYRLKKGQF